MNLETIARVREIFSCLTPASVKFTKAKPQDLVSVEVYTGGTTTLFRGTDFDSLDEIQHRLGGGAKYCYNFYFGFTVPLPSFSEGVYFNLKAFRPQGDFYGLPLWADWLGSPYHPLDRFNHIVGRIVPGEPGPKFQWWTPLGQGFKELLDFIRNEAPTFHTEDEFVLNLVGKDSLLAMFVILVFHDDIERLVGRRHCECFDIPGLAVSRGPLMEWFVVHWVKWLNRPDWWYRLVEVAAQREIELNINARAEMENWLSRNVPAIA